MYDVAIVGSGPAAISAALNFKLHNKSIIWFGSKELSDKVEKSHKIANYPGLSMISGEDLNQAFLKQIEEMDIEITEKMVTNIMSTKKGFMLLGDNDIYDAKTVLLTTGVVNAKSIKGELENLGKGVSYCATCDGFLYKNKTIGVICGAPRYEHEVKYLAEIVDKVYLYTPYQSELKLDNVETIKMPIKTINGNDKVESITLFDETNIEIDGLFIIRDAVAPATLMNGIEMDDVHIVVNRKMETNKKGCYAAGDCTGRPYQIAKAVGEGNVAAHSIIEYLDALEK